MGRAVKQAKLDSKEARSKLGRNEGKPYWREIETGLHLGYSRGRNSGSWLVRRHVGAQVGADGKKLDPYVRQTFARADDIAPSNGETILSFKEAFAKAREIGPRLGKDGDAPKAIVTVSDAINSYLDLRAANEDKLQGENGPKRRDARSRLTKHVFEAAPDLAAKKLRELQAEDLSQWREARRESGISEETVRRALSDFRAALNSTAHKHRRRFPGLAGEVRTGFKSEKPVPPTPREHQKLSDADVRRLVLAAEEIDLEEGWEGDLLQLVVSMAATGARFSQVVRMRVADIDHVNGRLLVPVSRKGRGEKVRKYQAVPVGDDVIKMLRLRAAGRRGVDFLFIRPRWKQVAVGKWEKCGREEWRSPSELKRPWDWIIERADLPKGTVPYCLRHSSIIRGLRANLPVRLVAALHDTSVAMIEAHYAEDVVDAMDDVARLAVVPLLPAPPMRLREIE